MDTHTCSVNMYTWLKLHHELTSPLSQWCFSLLLALEVRHGGVDSKNHSVTAVSQVASAPLMKLSHFIQKEQHPWLNIRGWGKLLLSSWGYILKSGQTTFVTEPYTVTCPYHPTQHEGSLEHEACSKAHRDPSAVKNKAVCEKHHPSPWSFDSVRWYFCLFLLRNVSVRTIIRVILSWAIAIAIHKKQQVKVVVGRSGDYTEDKLREVSEIITDRSWHSSSCTL